MLFQEEDGVVLFADPLDGLENDVDQHWRQIRLGPYREYLGTNRTRYSATAT